MSHLSTKATGLPSMYDEIKRLEAGNKKLKTKLRIATKCLEMACGGGCARGINPCYAREALERIAR